MFTAIAKNRWFIWAIVALLVAGVFLWLEVQRDVIDADTVVATDSIIYVNKKPPAQNISDTTDSPRDEVLRGWKTYRNEKYGFEFQYPADLNATFSSTTTNDSLFSSGYTEPGDFPPSMGWQVLVSKDKNLSFPDIVANEDHGTYFSYEVVENYLSNPNVKINGMPTFRFYDKESIPQRTVFVELKEGIILQFWCRTDEEFCSKASNSINRI